MLISGNRLIMLLLFSLSADYCGDDDEDSGVGDTTQHGPELFPRIDRIRLVGSSSVKL